MTAIRTPDDEIDKPGYLYPPFTEGWTYQGQTYAGHSDFSVDWNRRTKTGGWLDDRGDPVLASADGTVKETTPADGYVLINHAAGYASEYRHMQPVSVKPGDKVQRGDRIGSIGEAGNAPNGTHLHAVHYKDGKRIKMRFEGKDIGPSVADSDTKPATWKAPDPVMVEGPPPKATWESAYREAAKALAKGEERLATEERDDARAVVKRTAAERDKALADWHAAVARVKELEALGTPDCAAAVTAERKRTRDVLVAAVDAAAAGLA